MFLYAFSMHLSESLFVKNKSSGTKRNIFSSREFTVQQGSVFDPSNVAIPSAINPFHDMVAYFESKKLLHFPNNHKVTTSTEQR